MSHDQNFKNLILDYPRQAIGFFAAAEAQAVDAGARLLPIREEQLKTNCWSTPKPSAAWSRWNPLPRSGSNTSTSSTSTPTWMTMTASFTPNFTRKR